MSEILVPLLELPVTKKAPAGKLPSKADFLCLLYGSIEGNFEGFPGTDRHSGFRRSGFGRSGLTPERPFLDVRGSGFGFLA